MQQSGQLTSGAQHASQPASSLHFQDSAQAHAPHGQSVYTFQDESVEQLLRERDNTIAELQRKLQAEQLKQFQINQEQTMKMLQVYESEQMKKLKEDAREKANQIRSLEALLQKQKQAARQAQERISALEAEHEQDLAVIDDLKRRLLEQKFLMQSLRDNRQSFLNTKNITYEDNIELMESQELRKILEDTHGSKISQTSLLVEKTGNETRS